MSLCANFKFVQNDSFTKKEYPLNANRLLFSQYMTDKTENITFA